MSNLARAGRNAISRFAPRAIQRASRAVGLIAGDDAARRAELAGAFATVLAMVGAFMSGRRAKRVLEEMESDPTLSFELVLARLGSLPETQRELAEAEVRRMITHLGDAIAPEAVVPMLRAIAAWSENHLIREDCVNACRALRDLDRAELGSLATLIGEAVERLSSDELLLTAAQDGELAAAAPGQERVGLSRSRDGARLLRRLVDCDLARAASPGGESALLTRRRAELLRVILS